LASLYGLSWTWPQKNKKIKKSVGVREGLGLKPGDLNSFYFIPLCFNIWPNEKFQKKSGFLRRKV
jgi:hypothetical protein